MKNIKNCNKGDLYVDKTSDDYKAYMSLPENERKAINEAVKNSVYNSDSRIFWPAGKGWAYPNK